MNISSKDRWLILLISSLLIIVPIFVFPARLGLNLATGSFIYAIVEAIYYGLIFFIFCPGSTILQLLQGAGLTFLYRIVLGTIFGAVVAIMYNVGFSAALTLGISRYLPAIIFQIVIAPFALRPIFQAIAEAEYGKRKRHFRKYQPSATGRRDDMRPDPTRHFDHTTTAATERLHREPRLDHPAGAPEFNGFEKAVHYIGEHHAVILATVVDPEGLTLASFRKGEVDPEAWGPLALLLQKSNGIILNRNEKGTVPERLDLSFGAKKLTIQISEKFNLLVLADREDDEFVGIRIIQAVDMIKKYMSERYGTVLMPGPEEQYVSNT